MSESPPDLSPDAVVSNPAKPSVPSQSQIRNRARKARVEGALLLFLLLILAIGCRAARFPVEWPAHPGIMTVSPTVDRCDPPSMDELWHLTLSTGRGSPFFAYPRDTLVHDVPAWTSMDGAKPWWAVWTNMRDVTHPPLYVTTLRLWRDAFGGSDGVALACSVAWSCAAIVFLFLAVRLAAGRPAAFWAAAVLAVSPAATYYALEMRSYAMLTAEAAAAVWMMVRLTQHGSRWRDVTGLCVVLLAAMLTHYFSVFACLMAGAYTLAIARRRWPGVLLAGAITGGVYAAIWLPFALQQLHFAREGIDFLHTEERSWAYLSRLAAALPMRLLAESWSRPPLVVSAAIGVTILIAVIVAAVRRPTVRPFLVWYVGVVGFLFASDVLLRTQQVAFIRYPGAAQPAAAAFVPLIFATLLRGRWAVHVAGVAVCAGILLMQPDALHNDAPTWTTAVSRIVERIKPGDVLLVSADVPPGKSEYRTEALILEFAHVPGVFPRDAAILYKPISPDLAAQLAGRRAWLLTTGGADETPKFTPGARVVERFDYWQNLSANGPTNGYLLEFPPTQPAN